MDTNEQPGGNANLMTRGHSGGGSPKTPPATATRPTAQQHRGSPAVRSIAWQPPPVHHAASVQSPRWQHSTDARSFDEVCNEHQYLIASLQRQDERIRALLGALCSVQTQQQQQQQVPQSPAEVRKLRKDAGFVQSKIADAEQQEHLIRGRLLDVWSEMQRRNRLSHFRFLQQIAQGQVQMGPGDPPQLWMPTYPPEAAAPTPLSGNPISPLAPVFQPRNALNTESEKACRLDWTVDVESDNAESASRPASIIRRASSSKATDLLQERQKRMSLPPLRSVWPDDSG